MESNTPQVISAAPVAPNQAAPQQPPAAPIQPAPHVDAAVQPIVAPPAKRNRAPRGLVPPSNVSGSIGIPALLELGASSPMYTEQRRVVNYFAPDSQMAFHVLGLCDQMMLSTDRFLKSSPGWLPIVSQLYFSLLWWYSVLKVYVTSGYAPFLAQLLHDLEQQLNFSELLVPGPLVPFLSALAAVSGPYDWIGDIVTALPNLDQIIGATVGNPWQINENFMRLIPIPLVLLDQLAYFARWVVPAGQSLYGNFEWFRNILSLGIGASSPTFRMGPNLCGSLYSTQTQVTDARNFWHARFAGFTRFNAAAGQAVPTEWTQLLGFTTQTGVSQLNWFQHVTIIMQKYCQFFNGSVPLKAISPTGIGAVSVFGRPVNNADVRNWLYPDVADLTPFLSSRVLPLRDISDNLSIIFEHADVDAEEVAEQYALTSHTNIQWNANIATQNGWTVIDRNTTHTGSYWQMMAHRYSSRISFKMQYAQVVASRYHQQSANKTV